MKNGDYILIVAPPDYPGKRYRGKYCYEHHYNYWIKNGVLPKCGELIHHKNKNRIDNDDTNLELKTVSKHNTEHHPKVTVFCGYCKKSLTLHRWYYNQRLYLSKMNNVFCNRSCATKYQWEKGFIDLTRYSDVVQTGSIPPC